MATDIICAENEMSQVANSMVNYADFLVRCIDDYLEIILFLELFGIKDQLIISKLQYLSATLEPLRESIVEETKAVAQNVKSDIEEIESADNFRFPSSFQTIMSLISQF